MKSLYILSLVLLTTSCVSSNGTSQNGSAADSASAASTAQTTLANDANRQVSSISDPTQASNNSNSNSNQNTNTNNDYSLGSYESQTLNIDVSYRTLSRVLNESMNDAIDQEIRNTNCDNVKTSEYNCGEVPFGTIVDSDKKVASQFTFPDFDGKDGDVSFSLNGGKNRIFISRNQRKGSLEIADLDSVSKVTLNTSAKMGRDNFIGLLPASNGSLNQYVCVNLPGFRIFTEDETLNGHIKKKMWWIIPDIKADLKVKVDAGQLMFDNAKICAEFNTEISASAIPNVQLLKVGNPVFTNLTHKGLDIEVKANVDGFWQVVNSITKVFGFDITKIIENKVRARAIDEVQDKIEATINDVESGKWINKYLTNKFIEPKLQKLNTQIASKMKQMGFGKNAAADTLSAVCVFQANKLIKDSSLRAKFFKICKQAPKLDAISFAKVGASSTKGCYENYFNSNEYMKANGTPKWWADQCHIRNSIQMRVPSSQAEIYSCFFQEWNNATQSSRCASLINNYIKDITDGRLDQLLNAFKDTVPTNEVAQELRKLGVNHSNESFIDATSIIKLWK